MENVNPQGVDFYRKVFEAIKSKGDSSVSQSLPTLNLPFALQEDGDGWENKATVSAYEDYARFCFETYGDLVDQWITFKRAHRSSRIWLFFTMPIIHIRWMQRQPLK